jgi:hypothetical protein
MCVKKKITRRLFIIYDNDNDNDAAIIALNV